MLIVLWIYKQTKINKQTNMQANKREKEEEEKFQTNKQTFIGVNSDWVFQTYDIATVCFAHCSTNRLALGLPGFCLFGRSVVVTMPRKA